MAALESPGVGRPEVDDVRGVFGTELALLKLILTDVQYFRAWSGDLAPERSSSPGP